MFGNSYSKVMNRFLFFWLDSEHSDVWRDAYENVSAFESFEDDLSFSANPFSNFL